MIPADNNLHWSVRPSAEELRASNWLLSRKLRIYEHGRVCSSGAYHLNFSRASGKRDRPGGWTRESLSGLNAKLFSVDGRSLMNSGGRVYAYTLTYRRHRTERHRREVPSIERVRADVAGLITYMDRLGMDCYMWLIEFTAKLWPHVHWVVRLPVGVDSKLPVIWWLARQREYACKHDGQDWKPITDYRGWLVYLGKHAARQAAHYQRRELPPEWGGYSGRMWGFSQRGWNFIEPDEYQLAEDAVLWFDERRKQLRMDIAEHRSTKPVGGCRGGECYVFRKILGRYPHYWDDRELVNKNLCGYCRLSRQWRKKLSWLRRRLKGCPPGLLENMKKKYPLDEGAAEAGVKQYDKLIRVRACQAWSGSAGWSSWSGGKSAERGQGTSLEHDTLNARLSGPRV